MNKQRVFAAFAVVAAVVLWGYLAGGRSSQERVRAQSLHAEGKRNSAPEFALRDADGKTVRLND